MKKTLFARILLLLLLVVIVSFISCKKSSEVTDSIDTGNGDFIEFKIDGTHYKYALPSYIPAAASYQEQPTIPFYVVGMGWTNIAGQDYVDLQLGNFAPLTVTDYPFTPIISLTERLFLFVLDNGYEYKLNESTAGHIQLTNFDGIKGHKIEGKFSFTKADYYLRSPSTFQSGNHVITEGSFKATLQ